ncbi:MAG: translation initiation factor IF-2 [Clostridia bacterium]|nr:translation initiation factor IF-2 [Clostridia bacterium]
MARIKDFAKDLGLDIKDALVIIEKYGLGQKQITGNIEDEEISTFLNKYTLDHQATGLMEKYLLGEVTIGGKKKATKNEEAKPEKKQEKNEEKKPEPKAEVKPEIKVEKKEEPKPVEKKPEVKEEPKVEAKPEKKEEVKVEPKPVEKKPEVKVEPKIEPKVEPRVEPKVEKKEEQKPKFEPKFEKKPERPEGQGQRQGGNQGYQQKNNGFEKKFDGRNNFDNKRNDGKFEKKFDQRDNNKKGNFGFDKDGNEKKTYNVMPKIKKPESNVVEIKTKTGATRLVDTRSSNVNLSKYDEKFEVYEEENEKLKGGSGNRQKLKKQNNKDNFGSKKEKERLAMEKLKREAFEKAKNTQLSVTVPDEITVGELATRFKVNSGEVIKKLMLLGVMASVNQTIDYDTAYLIGDELGIKVSKEVVVTIEEKLFEEVEDSPESLKERAPVVCVMGHVDHGKTSLLDAIRHTHVTTGEAGGITQHIGAYRVNINGKDITFLDTPGHEAFTAMRLRGAMATDIAIIVVAADDGIMPQTVEAINHAKAAGVDIVVAINKMDKPTANPENIKQELTKYDLVPEEWGGDIMCIPVSAHTKKGIDDLLESVLLIAEVKELKANPDRLAKGIVIEAKLDKGRGPVATILVQNGTLKSGDVVIAGTAVGHVRAMTDHNGRNLKVAGPSVPVEITGLSEVPQAGDEFNAVKDEKMARELAEQRKAKAKEEVFKANAKLNLDDLFAQISDGAKEISIIVKADVGGSAEAVKASLVKLSNPEVKVSVIHTAVGGITEGDVMLAAASNAIIVGFNVRPDKSAIDSAERQGVDIRTHRIIYEIIEEIEAAMKGMLAPTYKEVINGHAEVRQTIRVPGVGTIAGSYVQDGKITRQSLIRIIRNGVVIAEDKISSLKRFKDDAKEVASGYECGIGLDKFNDIKEGDILEAYEMQEVAR